jgi:hypothetical protein
MKSIHVKVVTATPTPSSSSPNTNAHGGSQFNVGIIIGTLCGVGALIIALLVIRSFITYKKTQVLKRQSMRQVLAKQRAHSEGDVEKGIYSKEANRLDGLFSKSDDPNVNKVIHRILEKTNQRISEKKDTDLHRIEMAQRPLMLLMPSADTISDESSSVTMY